jgi:hypothetical protein
VTPETFSAQLESEGRPSVRRHDQLEQWRTALLKNEVKSKDSLNRGGSRISGTGVQPLKKGTHGGGAAPDSERRRYEAPPPEKLENSSANMRFPGIWE